MRWMKSASPVRNQFAQALKRARTCKGLTQEDFSLISSRTYVSSLERGQKSPTLKKVEELASAMGIHPLTLLTMSYCIPGSAASEDQVLSRVKMELQELYR